MDDQTVLDLRSGIHARPFQQEIVVLDVGTGEYYALEPIGARIWQHLVDGRSLGDVVNALAEDYDVDVARLREDVVGFAAELVHRRLFIERRAGGLPSSDQGHDRL
jgi:Coenzyme PQQ synthesis protein D (PqqD)